MPRIPKLASSVLPGFAALLAAVLCLPGALLADSLSTDNQGASYISDFFRATVDTAVAADSEQQAIARVTPLLDDHISLDETARFVLGRYWPADNPAAGRGFQAAFRSFVAEAFVRGVRTHPDLTLTVSHTKQHEDGTLLVSSVLRLPAGTTVPMDWQLQKTQSDGRLRITDVAVAGIDARFMLRNIAAATLANGAGNLDTLIALFRRSIAPAVATQPASIPGDVSAIAPIQQPSAP
jgi:ABC-type transporter MlaC component